MGFCWGTLLIVVLAAVGGVVALYHLNSQIRIYVLNELEKHFPNLHINIGHVRLDEEKGITIHNLECFLPTQQGQQQPLLIIKETFFECPVTIRSLYKKEARIKKIVLREPIIQVSRTQNSYFDELKYFRPNPSTPIQSIPLEIIDGTLIYNDTTLAQNNPNSSAIPFKITGINASITPPESTTRPVLLADLDPKSPPPSAWKYNGNANGDLFRQLVFNGFFNPNDQQWEISASCRQFDWTSELLGYLPLKKNNSNISNITSNQNTQLQNQQSLESFQGRFDFGVSAVSDSSSPFGCRFALDGILSQGRMEFYEINRTLSELNTRFKITDDSIVIEKLTGIAEAARLVLSYAQEGLLEKRSATLAAHLRGFVFDGELVNVFAPFLNTQTEQLLARFDYAGTTDLDANLVFRNGRWKPQALSLNLSDLSFSFLQLPYKLERLTGTLQVDNNAKLAFQFFTKKGEPIDVQIAGEYRNVFVDPYGQVRITGVGVPIDSKLLNALPEEQRNVVMTLNPVGKIDVELKILLPAGDAPLQKLFAIGLNDVAVKYDRFPYPLGKIYGQLLMDNNIWTFRNIIGTNSSAIVQCHGHLKPVPITSDNSLNGSPTQTMELLILLEAEELPIDDQLAGALLNTDQRELLTGLQIKGKIDLNAQIRYHSQNNRLNLQFRALPRTGFSMCPTRFPYRFDNVQGEIVYEDGYVHSKLLTGNNQETQLRTGLDCRFSNTGQWALRLSPLTINQLPPNRELQDALPSNLREIVENLQIGKPFNLNGSVEFLKQGQNSPLLTVWNLGVILHQNSAKLGVAVDNIFGEIQLAGYSVNDIFQLAGELNLDSVTVRGFQTTNLRGPFFFNSTPFVVSGSGVNLGVGSGSAGQGAAKQIYLGRQAGKILPMPPEIPSLQEFRQLSWFAAEQPAKPITGRFFDGTLYGEGLIVLANNGFSYGINTALIGADLAKIARELEPSAQKIAGTLNCTEVHLHGHGRKLELLGGTGKIQLRNANIYEAPGMIRLLRELSIRETDPNAGVISSADVDFQIMGSQVILNPIVFEGGAFLLQGDGLMRLDNRNVDLTMKTRLGNRRAQIPVVSDILGGAGDQIVQLKIRGPISDPTITRVALPEIQKAIMQIQGEEAAETTSQPVHSNQRSGVSRFFQWKSPSF
ncbi:MAG: AsmA-like C-terminal region-containing protein [Planctomycetaceae bacterium]|nr:AsmA-like C-terminal region-containing protein [Planctomycetaceae bacterium]